MSNTYHEQRIYVGTYAAQEEPGIYLYTMNTQTGELALTSSVSGIANPSFLTLDASRQRLYAVSEMHTFADRPGGGVVSFAISPQDGALTQLNTQPTYGNDPCYLSVDSTGTNLLVSNYTGGSISLFPLLANGEIGPLAERIQHSGHGPNPQRQEAPHPHSIVLTPSERYALVPDLGLDTIFSYKLDRDAHRLTLQGETRVAAGSGPRHLAFSPAGGTVYVINELLGTITAFALDEHEAMLRELQIVSTLPEDFKGENTCAEIRVAPSGKFLYGSNRGHDSIVVFAIEPETGKLSYLEHVSTGGKTPRNFAIAPNGDFLLVANQDSDSLVSYRIDQSTGRLTATGQVVSVSRPVCVAFV